MQFLPPCAQQGAIGGVLHQRVLEEIGGLRRDTAAEQQPGLGEPIEPGSQFGGGALRHLFDQFVAELAADDRADLPDLLGDRPEPIEPRDQRGVQGGGDRELRQRGRSQHRGDPIVAIAGFEHRFRQLFDEQRHAVGALDDLGDGFPGKAGIPCKLLDQRRAVMPAEPVQRQHRHMRLAAPGSAETQGER